MVERLGSILRASNIIESQRSAARSAVLAATNCSVRSGRPLMSPRRSMLSTDIFDKAICRADCFLVGADRRTAQSREVGDGAHDVLRDRQPVLFGDPAAPAGEAA